MLRQAEYNAPEPPILKRYLINDSTVEKLGEILSQNPSGALYYRDELTGLLEQISKKDRAAERPFYLEAWNGSNSYAFDRIGRGTVNIENLTLSIIGGIQPGKFKTYLEKRNQGIEGVLSLND